MRETTITQERKIGVVFCASESRVQCIPRRLALMYGDRRRAVRKMWREHAGQQDKETRHEDGGHDPK